MKAQASVYGVSYSNYQDRIQSIKDGYLNEINKLKEEWQFQFTNLQLELRELLANQKISIANAKKYSDMKKEFLLSDEYKIYLNNKSNFEKGLNEAVTKKDYDYYYNQLSSLENPTVNYIKKRDTAIERYKGLDIVIKNCEQKIDNCINDTYSEIDRVINENVENALTVIKENVISKIISKVVNIFSGKSKFENKIKLVEENISSLNSNTESRLEQIRNNTINLVAEIGKEKENISSENVA